MSETSPAAAPFAAIVASVVAETLSLDSITITPAMALDDEPLACDQLDRLEIAINLEQVCGVAISDDDLYACASVGDLAALVARLGAAAPAGEP